MFKSLEDERVTVELKNDLSVTGTLHDVDDFTNIRLTDIEIDEPSRFPHLVILSLSLCLYVCLFVFLTFSKWFCSNR